MSFFDDASWVLIPEGIKEDVVYAQKPTNGLGDLTFTRASDATRTNSAGVIERTPWNLFTQSVWTGGGALPTGWSYSFNTGTSAPVTSLYSTTNVAYSFVTSSTRQVFNQSLSYIAGQSYHLSVLVEAVSGSVRIDQVLYFNATGTQTFFKDGVPANASDFVVAGSRYAAVIVSAVTTSQQVRIGNGCVGNSTGTVVLSQPQLVEGTDAKPYFATTNRQDVPRLDYRNADGTVSTCPRLLLEPQRTNSIRNSTMVGAVAGSPGTFPTNWGITAGGLTQTIVGIGTESGIQYVDVRLNGTATGTFVRYDFEGSTNIAASNGQAWSESVWIKSISGTVPQLALRFNERTSLGALVKTADQNITISSTLQRFTFSRTLDGGATVAVVQPSLLATISIGVTYDFTIRIAAPQMELGASSTTFIPTTTAAVTRIGDSCSKVGVSSLIGQTQGTIYVEANIANSDKTVVRSILGIGDGTTANRISIRRDTNGRVVVIFLVGGVSTSFNTANDQVGQLKIAVGYAANNSVLYVNGTQAAFGGPSPASIAATSNIYVGQLETAGGGNQLDGSIAQAALFPTRFTNAQLAQITTL